MEDNSANAVQKANAFSSAAEDYTEKGQYAQAIEAHFRAAEQFLLATTYTTDADAARTLRMLYANHTRKGKDLQRRHSRASVSSASPVSQQPTPTSATATQPLAPTLQPIEKDPELPKQTTSHQKQPVKQSIPQDDIAINKQHQQKRLHQQGMWTTGFEGESMSGYDSRHFFLGQSTTGSGMQTVISDEDSGGEQAVTPLQGGRDPNITKKQSSPLSNLSNTYSGPATLPVESLDASVVQPRVPLGTERQPYLNNRRNSNMSDTMDSYYMLDEQQADKIPKIDEDVPDDPFNKFWDVVENLVQKISSTAPLQAIQQQTAMIPQWSPAAAPMPPLSSGRAGQAATQPQMFVNLKGFKNPPPNPSSASSTSQQQQKQKQTLQPHQQYSPSASVSGNNMLNSYFVVPNNGGSMNTTASYLGGTGGIGYDSSQPYPEGGDIRIVHDGDGGTNVIRGGNSSGPGIPRKLRSVVGGNESRATGNRSKTMEELQIENEQLKHTVDFLAKRVSALEKADQENNMLKSSIIQFRQDVQRQAKRYGIPGSASMTGPLAPRYNSTDTHVVQQRRPNHFSPSSSGLMNSQGNMAASHQTKTTDSEGTAAIARVAALEDELRTLKETYDKEVGELTKYKERWLKVKESAKRKKEGKAAAELAASTLDENSMGGLGAVNGMEASTTSSTSGVINHAASTLGKSEYSPAATPSPVRKPFNMVTTPLATDPPFTASVPPQSFATDNISDSPYSSQLKTPTASMMTAALPPHGPKLVPLASSVVMDSSAALLSSHLLDPTAPQRTSLPFSSNTVGNSRNNIPFNIVDARNLQTSDGGENRGRRSGDDGSLAANTPSDLAESGVSTVLKASTMINFGPPVVSEPPLDINLLSQSLAAVGAGGRLTNGLSNKPNQEAPISVSSSPVNAASPMPMVILDSEKSVSPTSEVKIQEGTQEGDMLGHPENDARYRHALLIAGTLKKRLAYAVYKVQNGWENESFENVKKWTDEKYSKLSESQKRKAASLAKKKLSLFVDADKLSYGKGVVIGTATVGPVNESTPVVAASDKLSPSSETEKVELKRGRKPKVVDDDDVSPGRLVGTRKKARAGNLNEDTLLSVIDDSIKLIAGASVSPKPAPSQMNPVPAVATQYPKPNSVPIPSKLDYKPSTQSQHHQSSLPTNTQPTQRTSSSLSSTSIHPKMQYANPNSSTQYPPYKYGYSRPPYPTSSVPSVPGTTHDYSQAYPTYKTTPQPGSMEYIKSAPSRAQYPQAPSSGPYGSSSSSANTGVNRAPTTAPSGYGPARTYSSPYGYPSSQPSYRPVMDPNRPPASSAPYPQAPYSQTSSQPPRSSQPYPYYPPPPSDGGRGMLFSDGSSATGTSAPRLFSGAPGAPGYATNTRPAMYGNAPAPNPMDPNSRYYYPPAPSKPYSMQSRPM
ncbi:UNVERIFIED_CONTAM: hypothetical protein HDU68_002664 [Siphonaria sp. JEL0065]|nr:hypothetical protein HDU68_002664 [Siphonaria sp. JEL0065]